MLSFFDSNSMVTGPSLAILTSIIAPVFKRIEIRLMVIDRINKK